MPSIFTYFLRRAGMGFENNCRSGSSQPSNMVSIKAKYPDSGCSSFISVCTTNTVKMFLPCWAEDRLIHTSTPPTQTPHCVPAGALLDLRAHPEQGGGKKRFPERKKNVFCFCRESVRECHFRINPGERFLTGDCLRSSLSSCVDLITIWLTRKWQLHQWRVKSLPRIVQPR